MVCLKINLPHVIPKPHFLSSEKHKGSYFVECLSCSFPFNESTGKSIKTVHLHKAHALYSSSMIKLYNEQTEMQNLCHSFQIVFVSIKTFRRKKHCAMLGLNDIK